MERINVFDKNLFMNGKLAIIVETLEQLERVPEWFQANEIRDVFLTLANRTNLSYAIQRRELYPYFRYSFNNINTGYSLDVASDYGCTHFCYMTDCYNLQVSCDEFEEFLKPFW